MGGAKASPRICAAGLSMPPITADWQQPFFCSKSDTRSIYKLSPPPKMRTERNLQNSRLNPDETSSLVDLERRIPAKCAFLTQVMRESRKLKTRWRSRVNSNSRATLLAVSKRFKHVR
jgi:hypothetical protein